VAEGIKAVRQTISLPDGSRPLRVNPRCQHLIYEMGEYRSDPSGKSSAGELIPLKVDDHTEDALRYLIFKRRHMTG